MLLQVLDAFGEASRLCSSALPITALSQNRQLNQLVQQELRACQVEYVCAESSFAELLGAAVSSSSFMLAIDADIAFTHPPVHVPTPFVVPMAPPEPIEAMPPGLRARFFFSQVISPSLRRPWLAQSVNSVGNLGR